MIRDHLLVSLGSAVQPLRLEPTLVLAGDRPAPQARERLLDSSQTLVTFPGDAYTLVYELPAVAERYELFLETRGYYLEWMRQEWLAEENLARAAQFFLDPDAALRRLAPEFKWAEPGLEAAFWRSKYAGS